jgi:hypothetical protein
MHEPLHLINLLKLADEVGRSLNLGLRRYISVESAQVFVEFVLTLDVMVTGCEASLSLKKLLLEAEDQRNVTLASDNVCLKSIVEQRQIVYYNLDSSACFEDSSFRFLEVEARIFQQCADSHEWSVLVNTEGELVPIENAKASSNGTFVDFIGMWISTFET